MELFSRCADGLCVELTQAQLKSSPFWTGPYTCLSFERKLHVGRVSLQTSCLKTCEELAATTARGLPQLATCPLHLCRFPYNFIERRRAHNIVADAVLSSCRCLWLPTLDFSMLQFPSIWGLVKQPKSTRQMLLPVL